MLHAHGTIPLNREIAVQSSSLMGEMMMQRNTQKNHRFKTYVMNKQVMHIQQVKNMIMHAKDTFFLQHEQENR